jgi:hypothetical protein
VRYFIVDGLSGERSRGKGKDDCELHVGRLRCVVWCCKFEEVVDLPYERRHKGGGELGWRCDVG